MSTERPPSRTPRLGTGIWRGETWAPGLVGLLAAAVVVIAPYPPMTDFPHHEALVSLLRTMGDGSLFPPGMYVRNLGHPNQLFHLLAWPLSYVVSVTLACKAVVALAVGAMPAAAARLARHYGATPLVGLLAVPLAFGWLFYWGFVSNLLGLALLMAVLPALDDFIKQPTARGAAGTLGAVVALYLAHELMLFVYLAAVGIFAILRPLTVRMTALRFAPLAFGTLVAGAQVVLQEHLKTATLRILPNLFWPFRTLLGQVPLVLVGGRDASTRLVCFSLGLIAIALFGIERYRRHAASEKEPLGLRERLWGYRLELLATVCLVVYFAAPVTLNGAALVSQRFLAPAYMLFAIAAAAGSQGKAGLVPRALACSLPVATLFVTLPTFADAAANYRAMESLFPTIPLKTSVALVDLDLDEGGRPFNVASGLSRVLIGRGGRVSYSFTDSTVAPVRINPACQWDEPSARIMRDHYSFRPSYDMTRFQYLLLHGSHDGALALALGAIAPDALPVGQNGEWVLLRSTHDVAPIDGPDAPLPEPHPATLRKRMKQIALDHAARLREDAAAPAPKGD